MQTQTLEDTSQILLKYLTQFRHTHFMCKSMVVGWWRRGMAVNGTADANFSFNLYTHTHTYMHTMYWFVCIARAWCAYITYCHDKRQIHDVPWLVNEAEIRSPFHMQCQQNALLFTSWNRQRQNESENRKLLASYVFALQHVCVCVSAIYFLVNILDVMWYRFVYAIINRFTSNIDREIVLPLVRHKYCRAHTHTPITNAIGYLPKWNHHCRWNQNMHCQLVHAIKMSIELWN